MIKRWNLYPFWGMVTNPLMEISTLWGGWPYTSINHIPYHVLTLAHTIGTLIIYDHMEVLKMEDPQVTIVASILSHAHPFSLDDWGVPPWMTWSLLATWGVYPPELGQYRLGLQSLGLSCLQRRDAGEKGKGTNQSMYFLMTPERNSSFAITSHLYNYINKYKYNICIMTLYNYIYI